MSQSPVAGSEATDEYLDGWNQLSQMIRNGRSFSGRERNCCFLNTRQQRFADVSAATGFDFPDDGRGLALVDWDHDGDLDAWIANRSGPQVRLLLNQMQTDHQWLALRLQGTECNRDAIGARVTVITQGDEERPQIQTVRAGEGFLSQSSKWLHFGLGHDDLSQVVVQWPGAERPEIFEGIHANARFKIVQGTGQALSLDPRPQVLLEPSDLTPTPSGEAARIVLLQRRQLDDLSYRDFSQQPIKPVSDSAGPRLVNLWASWCQPCVAELTALQARSDELEKAQLSVTALCVDLIQDEYADPEPATALAKTLDSIECGWAETDLLRKLTDVHNQVLYRQRSLPVPCSFLLDAQGAIAVIYRGPIEVDQLLSDVQLLNRSTQELAQTAVPFSGRNVARRFSPHGVNLALAYLEGGYLDDARSELEKYVQQFARSTADRDRERLLQAYQLLARIAQRQVRPRDQIDALRRVIELRPTEFESHIELAFAMMENEGNQQVAHSLLEQATALAADEVPRILRLGQAFASIGDTQRAIRLFQQATDLDPTGPEPRFNLAMALQLTGQSELAIAAYDQLLREHPQQVEAANNLAWLLATEKDPKIRNAERAVELASRACAATQYSNSSYLDTLAEAHAAAGNDQAAADAVSQALANALKKENRELVEKLRKRLDRFQQRANLSSDRE